MSEDLKQTTEGVKESDSVEQTTKKKSKGKIVGSTIAFLLVLALVFGIVCEFLKLTEPVNIACLEGLYKEKENSLDVVLIGASEVYANYIPTAAYEEFGYTSYAYGNSGVPGSLIKPMLKEVKETQNPKLVVIEMNGFMQKDSYYEREGNLHGLLDNIHYGENRNQAIKEAIPEDKREDYEIKNFLNVYHTSWKTAWKCFATLYTRIGMKLIPESTLKGFASFAKHAKKYDEDLMKKEYFTDKSKYYLEDLLNYCDETNTKVLFVRFPHQNKETPIDIQEQIAAQVNAHGYDFVDFSRAKEDAGIVPLYDYYNDEHFNIRGAKKFTSYFGKFLIDNYDVKSEHSQEVIASWDKCVEKANKLFAKIEAELEQNKGTHYYEMSVYLF